MTKPTVVFTVTGSRELEGQCSAVKCLILARAGWHTSAIADATGLSPSQVQYRIRKGECRGVRRDYRDGVAEEARIAVKAVTGYVLTKRMPSVASATRKKVAA